MSPISRRTLVGAAIATPALVRAQAAAPTRPHILMQTHAGPITMEMASDRAPISCANFLRYVDTRRLDGAAFYRALKVQPDPLAGLVQGGVTDGAKLLAPIAHEPTTKTGLKHVEGAVSLARLAPGTARADFFISVGDFPSFDADPSQPGDNLGFAVFGRVTDGMDTVRAILTSPVSPTAGEGPMKGQMLDPKIRILTVRRV
ncbi:MAG TPA: peptidylprolyl isomerase [Caulobacteraceae bacterium]|jgi:peptidyl-prolyl cis-trans isomerase A (cyclophilin A)|nr:peptidylprolyl isomerase [Caulobacteraceae bacterium]